MKFSPMPNEERANDGYLIPSGLYDFEVVEAQDQISKAGRDMIKLRLKVFRGNGGHVTVFDYLLEAMKFKLLHFCREVGLESAYEAGDFGASDCVGKTGKVRLIVKRDEEFGDKNEVKDYGDDKEKPKGMGSNAPANVQQRAAAQPSVSVSADDPPF